MDLALALAFDRRGLVVLHVGGELLDLPGRRLVAVLDGDRPLLVDLLDQVRDPQRRVLDQRRVEDLVDLQPGVLHERVDPLGADLVERHGDVLGVFHVEPARDLLHLVGGVAAEQRRVHVQVRTVPVDALVASVRRPVHLRDIVVALILTSVR
ncbi:hypothetical protein BRC66_02935 [Halobacteriales archaeon QH_2_66_30]|nr:MAG: hypothetical protein BRC66_02935 [Halobacteriales archaeon QH_2_66_30]